MRRRGAEEGGHGWNWLLLCDRVGSAVDSLCCEAKTSVGVHALLCLVSVIVGLSHSSRP